MPKTKVHINRNEDLRERRHHGVNLRSRLLCPVCKEVKPVQEIDGGKLITLSCGHKRHELLPARKDHVSIEDLKSKQGRRAFPASNADEETASPAWFDMRPR